MRHARLFQKKNPISASPALPVKHSPTSSTAWPSISKIVPMMSIEMAPFRSLSKALKASFKTESVRKHFNETNVLTKGHETHFSIGPCSALFPKRKVVKSRHQLYLNAAVKTSQLGILRSCRRFFSNSLVDVEIFSTHRPKLLFRWLFTRQSVWWNFCHFWFLVSIIWDSTRWVGRLCDRGHQTTVAEWMSQSAELVRNAWTIGGKFHRLLLRFDVKLDLA